MRFDSGEQNLAPTNGTCWYRSRSNLRQLSSVEAAVLSGKFKNSSAETADTTVRRLVSEMPDAGEDHRHFAFVGGSDHFLVADGTARLNRASRACIRRGD